MLLLDNNNESLTLSDCNEFRSAYCKVHVIIDLLMSISSRPINSGDHESKKHLINDHKQSQY